MSISYNDRTIDDIPKESFFPYKMIYRSPESVKLEILGLYRFVGGTMLNRIMPVLALALVIVVLTMFDLREFDITHLFLLLILCILPFILVTRFISTELEFSPGLIRRKAMYGLYSKKMEHSINPGDRIEIAFTRGRNRVWAFYLNQGKTRSLLFFIPSANKGGFSTTEPLESKKNFIALLGEYLHIPVNDLDEAKG